MTLRMWLGLLLFSSGLALAGCGEIETQIRTSYPLDTNDTNGPYRIMAVITGEPGMKIWLVYSTDGWKDPKNIIPLEMENVSPDVFQVNIPGQKADTTISYYIMAQKPDNSVVTDPEKIADAVDKLIPQSKDLTYQFRIIK